MADVPKLQPIKEGMCTTPIDVPPGLREQYADLLQETRSQWQTIPADQLAMMNNPNKSKGGPDWVSWDTTINKPDGSPLNVHSYARPGLPPVILSMVDEKTGQSDRYYPNGQPDASRFYTTDAQGERAAFVDAHFSSNKDGVSHVQTEAITRLHGTAAADQFNKVTFTFDETGRVKRSVCE
jgi:hypothetical protein